MNRKDEHKEVDEDEAQQAASAHDQIYNQNGGQPNQEHSSRDLGSAADAANGQDPSGTE